MKLVYYDAVSYSAFNSPYVLWPQGFLFFVNLERIKIGMRWFIRCLIKGEFLILEFNSYAWICKIYNLIDKTRYTPRMISRLSRPCPLISALKGWWMFIFSYMQKKVGNVVIRIDKYLQPFFRGGIVSSFSFSSTLRPKRIALSKIGEHLLLRKQGGRRAGARFIH